MNEKWYPNQINLLYQSIFLSGSISDMKKDQFEFPMRELFVFAILQNWHDMAKLFWEEGRESIASALAGSKMLKGMASKEDDSDQIANMEEHAE